MQKANVSIGQGDILYMKCNKNEGYFVKYCKKCSQNRKPVI